MRYHTKSDKRELAINIKVYYTKSDKRELAINIKVYYTKSDKRELAINIKVYHTMNYATLAPTQPGQENRYYIRLGEII